jgi:hypothetical protein
MRGRESGNEGKETRVMDEGKIRKVLKLKINIIWQLKKIK